MTGARTGPATARPSDEERAWQPVGEDRLVFDGFMKVYQRTYRLPDGRTAVWDMSGTPRTVAVLALTPDGRLVMVRQFRPGPGRVVLSLPGGLVDPGEDVRDAAVRELREETGYAAGSVEVVVSVKSGNGIHARYVAIARDCHHAHSQDLDDFEDCEPVLLAVAEVRRELRAGRMTGSEQAYLALDHAGLL